ncbi:MAG: erythromycin esterase family protein [Acidimicrobiales bacterium]
MGRSRDDRHPPHPHVHGTAELLREVAEPFSSIDDADLGPLVERVGDCSVVLLGEASHGTSEFYRMRERITRELIVHKGFTAVAVEADWPDAACIDRFVRGRPLPARQFEPFERFPRWMWRNAEVGAFVAWLRAHNLGEDDAGRRVSFHGLDLYSLYASRAEVLTYLEDVDPEAAAVARHRYSCLSPWVDDPAAYGRAVVTGRFAGCEEGVTRTLSDLLRRRLEYAVEAGDDFLDAAQNAVVVANAERYYRVMYAGSTASWNLRDQHMFETLQTVRAARGPGAKVVVWEHNSHVGDASATEMGARGEHNVGMLCRRAFGDDAFLVGFGTHQGTVAAATDWGGPMEIKSVRPSLPGSYERLCHDSSVPAFALHLREPRRPEIREELATPMLERAIGVIYRPETERQSHYFLSSLPEQFDEYIWIDETTAVHALPALPEPGEADLFPFGL